MWQVKVPCTGDAAKELALTRAYLCNTKGVWELEHELVVYFAEKDDMDCFTRTQGEPGLLREKVSNKIDWIARWKKFHKVIRIKPFLIIPSFRKNVAAQPGYTKRVYITPSFAFGTGSHATTHMCVSYLARLVRKGMKALDMGTGSGILAICAEKLGASRITGIDIDEVALQEAKKNIRRNRCSKIRVASSLKKDDVDFDLCVCNILYEDIITLKPVLRKVLKRGGDLVLSGLLAEQEQPVIAAYADSFRCVSVKRMRDRNFAWVALHLVKL